MWTPGRLFSARSTKVSRPTLTESLDQDATIQGVSTDAAPAQSIRPASARSKRVWGAAVAALAPRARKEGRIKVPTLRTALPARLMRPRSANTQSSSLATQNEEGQDEELEAFTKRLLTGIYGQPLQASHAQDALAACPELHWLAECSRRMPLPPGWSRVPSKAEPAGKLLYRCDATSGVSDTPPCFRHFVELGRRVANTRASPQEALENIACIRSLLDEVNAELMSLEQKWSGPHRDPSTQAEYYHCASTDTSSWEYPGALMMTMLAKRGLELEQLLIQGNCSRQRWTVQGSSRTLSILKSIRMLPVTLTRLRNPLTRLQSLIAVMKTFGQLWMKRIGGYLLN